MGGRVSSQPKHRLQLLGWPLSSRNAKAVRLSQRWAGFPLCSGFSSRVSGLPAGRRWNYYLLQEWAPWKSAPLSKNNIIRKPCEEIASCQILAQLITEQSRSETSLPGAVLMQGSLQGRFMKHGPSCLHSMCYTLHILVGSRWGKARTLIAFTQTFFPAHFTGTLQYTFFFKKINDISRSWMNAS